MYNLFDNISQNRHKHNQVNDHHITCASTQMQSRSKDSLSQTNGQVTIFRLLSAFFKPLVLEQNAPRLLHCVSNPHDLSHNTVQSQNIAYFLTMTQSRPYSHLGLSNTPNQQDPICNDVASFWSWRRRSRAADKVKWTRCCLAD